MPLAHTGTRLESQRIRLAYARCSTDEQEGALEAQIIRLKEAGAEHVISELISGRNNDRPGMLEAMGMVKTGRVKELLVTRVDRLGRDAAYADQLIAMCSMHGVKIRALDGGDVEMATPQGFFMARTMSTLAEMESRMLSMRIKKQFSVYRAQGRHLRRRIPFGYTGGENHQLIPHPDNWDEARYVLKVLREQKGFASSVRRLGNEGRPWVPAPNNLQLWFVNPIIRGHLAHLYDKSSGKGWNASWKEIYYDQHEPLITEADWHDLAGILRRTKNNFHGKANVAAHGLTGLMRCSNCGTRLRRNSSAGTPWWTCRHRSCDNKARVKEEIALQWAVEAGVKAADDLARVMAQPPAIDPAIALKRRDLDEVRRLAARNPSMQPAVAALEREIQAMEAPPAETPDMELFKAALRNPLFFREATPEEQRAIFSGVLLEIQVGRQGQYQAVPRTP